MFIFKSNTTILEHPVITTWYRRRERRSRNFLINFSGKEVNFDSTIAQIGAYEIVTDRPTNQVKDLRAHREVTLLIFFIVKWKICESAKIQRLTDL